MGECSRAEGEGEMSCSLVCCDWLRQLNWTVQCSRMMIDNALRVRRPRQRNRRRPRDVSRDTSRTDSRRYCLRERTAWFLRRLRTERDELVCQQNDSYSSEADGEVVDVIPIYDKWNRFVKTTIFFPIFIPTRKDRSHAGRVLLNSCWAASWQLSQ